MCHQNEYVVCSLTTKNVSVSPLSTQGSSEPKPKWLNLYLYLTIRFMGLWWLR